MPKYEIVIVTHPKEPKEFSVYNTKAKFLALLHEIGSTNPVEEREQPTSALP